jgi:ComF family protein
MNFTSTFFNDLLNLLYPHICVGCGSDLFPKDVLCYECINNMPVTNFYRHRDNPVEKIFWGRLPVASGLAYAYFTKGSVIQNMLHELKYRGNTEIGFFMGRLMGEQLRNKIAGETIDGLIPLPLFAKKQKLRGYNQAELICEGMSSIAGISVMNDVIIRRKSTESQTRKGRTDRWKNMQSKFEIINADRIIDRHVMIVDDVITTGATVEACGLELLKVRGVRLSISAFAYTSL